jgi:threonine dehydrogenase-like Zn-dependent dehydrogenase
MKAIVFQRSLPRYALLRYAGPRMRSLYTSGASPVALLDVAPPKLPGPGWVRVTPKLTGVCGSDLATITCKGSPYLAPITSMPFVLGHEVVGVVSEAAAGVSRVSVGDRVVLQPALGCAVRGIAPPCERCAAGEIALCANVMRGVISPGIQTGYCRDTGGGWSEGFVAHESQLFRVPPTMSDRVAVLVEPFACALHAALRASPRAGETVFVMGCGAVGLLLIAALRASGCTSRIVAVARYAHQQRLATALGANELTLARGTTAERYAAWAAALGAEVLKPELGKPAIIGGADVTYDCVANSESLDDCIRFTRSGGTMVVVGMPGIPAGVDWTPLWYKELTLSAAYAYGVEGPDRRPTFELTLERLGPIADQAAALVGEPFALTDYRAAFRAALDTGTSGTVKTVFQPT